MNKIKSLGWILLGMTMIWLEVASALGDTRVVVTITGLTTIADDSASGGGGDSMACPG
jgi:hypothetical protein